MKYVFFLLTAQFQAGSQQDVAYSHRIPEIATPPSQSITSTRHLVAARNSFTAAALEMIIGSRPWNSVRHPAVNLSTESWQDHPPKTWLFRDVDFDDTHEKRKMKKNSTSTVSCRIMLVPLMRCMLILEYIYFLFFLHNRDSNRVLIQKSLCRLDRRVKWTWA